MPASMPVMAVYRLRKPFGPTISFEDLELVHRSQNRTLVEDFIHTWFGGFTIFTVTGSSQVDATFQGVRGKNTSSRWTSLPCLMPTLEDSAGRIGRRIPWVSSRCFPPLHPMTTWKFAREISDNEWTFLNIPAASLEPGEPPPAGFHGGQHLVEMDRRKNDVGCRRSGGHLHGDRLERFQSVPIRPGNPALQILPRFRAIAGTTYYFRTVPIYRTTTNLKLLVEAPNDRIENAHTDPRDS